MKKKTVNTRFLVELAVLIAIELLLEITGLGYIKTGFLSFTIMQVPVIVGAIVLGPLAGAILGTAFGLTSFWECFGKDPLGVVLLGARPFSTFILCVVPRLLNTVLFMSFLVALFGKVEPISNALATYGGNILKFIVLSVGVQGLLEAVICCVVGASVSYALLKFKK